MGVQLPERGAEQQEQVVGIERDDVRIAEERLAAGAQRVDQRQLAAAERLGEVGAQPEMALQRVAEKERLLPGGERRHDRGEQDDRGRDPGEEERRRAPRPASPGGSSVATARIGSMLGALVRSLRPAQW